MHVSLTIDFEPVEGLNKANDLVELLPIQAPKSQDGAAG